MRWTLLLLAALALAATAPAPATTNTVSQYPRRNVTQWYELDPTWPQRQPHAPWGQMPGVAVDRFDNVWIYTRTNPAVQVYSPQGRLIKTWPAVATNSSPHSIRIDRHGNVWLTDGGLHIVTKHAPHDGRCLLTLGTYGVAGSDTNHFDRPTDVAFGPNDDIYVTDGYGNARVVQFDKLGRFIRAWGSLGTAPGQFSLPHSIVCDSQGRLYVADRNNVRIQVFDRRGRLLQLWQDLLVPWGLCLLPGDQILACGSSPMIWAYDPKYPTAPLGCPPKDQLIMRFDRNGKLLQLWTFPKGADEEEQPGQLNWLHAVAVDSKGNLYCTDIIGRRIQKFIPKTER
ncbi:MAG: peptidyl-alpha-hydroxyglycine alpha-amidating lyase family protein [Verrucomicrobiae bacterium]|nr:peptidyl-alpha-hydroxyglycine alpha-amidating lyase family protein [Verrucomicrobiae bacterium]